MHIPVAIFACFVLVSPLFGPAQTAPASSTPGTHCGTLPKDFPSVEGILSDTHGVEFNPYLRHIRQIINSSWIPLIPKEADAPVSKSGEVVICVKILPNGRLMDGGMVLEGRSGDEALDRATKSTWHQLRRASRRCSRATSGGRARLSWPTSARTSSTRARCSRSAASTRRSN